MLQQGESLWITCSTLFWLGLSRGNSIHNSFAQIFLQCFCAIINHFPVTAKNHRQNYVAASNTDLNHSWKSITQMIIRHCQCHQPLYQKGSNNLSCFIRYRLIRKWNSGPWMHKKNIQELITKRRLYSVLWINNMILHKRDSSPQKNFFIIYSPSCLSKPIWVTFLCWTQKKTFCRI